MTQKKTPPRYVLISCSSCIHASKRFSGDPCNSCGYYEKYEPRNPEVTPVSCLQCKHAAVSLNEYPCSTCSDENDESALPNFVPKD